MQVADLIGADPKEIIFTSGATESNNLAIKGISNFYRDRKKHIITTQTERECHKKTTFADYQILVSPLSCQTISSIATCEVTCQVWLSHCVVGQFGLYGAGHVGRMSQAACRVLTSECMD